MLLLFHNFTINEVRVNMVVFNERLTACFVLMMCTTELKWVKGAIQNWRESKYYFWKCFNFFYYYCQFNEFNDSNIKFDNNLLTS